MKRVLSLVLAVVLCLGMTTMAFAADPTKISDYDIDWVSKSSKNLVNLWYRYANGTWTQETIKIADIKVADREQDDFPSNSETKFVINNNSATIPAAVAAATGTDATRIVVGYSSSDSSRVTALKTTGNNGYVATYILVKGGSDDKANFSQLAFATGASSTGEGGTRWYYITEGQKEAWDISVKLSKSTTSFTGLDIRYVTVPDANGNDVRAAVVGYKMATEYNGTGSKSNEDTLQVSVDGTRISKGDLKLKSVVKNWSDLKVQESDIDNPDETEVDADDFKTRQVEFKGYASKGIVNADYDTIFKGRFYAKKYLFQVTEDPDTTAEALMDKYNFDLYKKVTQIGMSDGNTVTWDLDDSFYVYTIDSSKSYDSAADSVSLKYVGKSDDDITLTGANVTHYFLSYREIDIDVAPAVDDEPPVEPTETSDVPSQSAGNPDGGPTGTISNANYNPGTGR